MPPVLVDTLFEKRPEFSHNVYVMSNCSTDDNQNQTNAAFSEKWLNLSQADVDENDAWKQMQFDWYLKLYGYNSESELAESIQGCRTILDAGCGLGYKAAWFARLAPRSTVIAMDFSDAVYRAASRYGSIDNLVFVKGDIADTGMRPNTIDLISCDQVLHHTESPPQTLNEFHRITTNAGRLNTYVYAKKAIPRELLDDYFRSAAKSISHEELWDMSTALTNLGRQLSDLQITIDVPDIPLLGIKGGKQDLQRFLYWNFIKCFWNKDLWEEVSVSTNFDWYSPSNAFRYSQHEFLQMCADSGWSNVFLHGEEACWSGRFVKQDINT